MSANPTMIASSPALVAVIDADATTRERVRALLEQLPVEVRTFASAAAFLRALGDMTPSCVIAEATMADMDGIALLGELKRRGLDSATILLSRNEDIPFAVAAMRAGAVDFIEKPYIDRALLHHVGHLVMAGQEPD